MTDESAADRVAAQRAARLFKPEDPLFKALIETSADMFSVMEVTDDGPRLRYVSPSVRSLMGYEAEELLSLDPGLFLGDVSGWPDLFNDLVLGHGETSPPIEIEVRHRDGTLRWIESRTTNLTDDPVVRGIVSNFRDVTAHRLAEKELELTRALADSVLESAHDAYIRVRDDCRITAWNRQAEQTFGRTRDEVLGRYLEQLIVPEDARRSFRERVFAATRRRPLPEGTPIADVEINVLRRDGSEFPAELTSWTTEAYDGIRFNAFIRDITERRALQRQLSHSALHDELTGLPNRNLIANSLTAALRRAVRAELQVAVLFCDLDQFKVINDSLGHSVGDQVLAAVADRLVQAIRVGDTIGRFGGDEFVVILDGVAGRSEASTLGERVLGTFAKPFQVAGYELFVTASIGIAVGMSSADPERLLADADAAMYRAKEKGRARLELFDPRMLMGVRERLFRRQEVGKALGQALERDELVLLYQPLVELDTGAVVGAEALLRWQRPGHGLVGPSGFLDLASDTGLIVPIDAWVLETACAQLQHWAAAVPDRELRMSVNQAARSLAAPTMLDHLRSVLAGNRCRADALTLDLDVAALGDVDALRPVLDEMRGCEVHVALDDFTTGPASLDTLRRIPADTLKIKRSLIANLVDGPYDPAVVAAIATTASALGHIVVAKGVETIEQARMAKRRRCGLAQGFLFSGPVTGDRFTELLLSGSRYDIDEP